MFTLNVTVTCVLVLTPDAAFAGDTEITAGSTANAVEHMINPTTMDNNLLILLTGVKLAFIHIWFKVKK